MPTVCAVTKHSEDSNVQEMDGEEDDDPSDDKIEKYSTLKKGDVKFNLKILLRKNAQTCLIDL